MSETLADALPKEITRAREILDQYKSLRGMPNVIVEPQILMMEMEIQAAIRACAQGDLDQMVRCLAELRELE